MKKHPTIEQQSTDTAVSSRMILASRYSDCLRRLSGGAARADRRDLGLKLFELSVLIDRMAFELATDERGLAVLARAGRLIGSVERMVADKERIAVVH